ELGIARRYTRPRRPQTNGKAEALIKTLQREWAYRFAYHSSTHRARALPSYLRWYNRHRPHSSLSGQPPTSRVSQVRGSHS
ncbi:MAG TPA: integrase core domain-containing protein, partial [Gaiellaceae bacterium]|nr:integrase core domain-containing protein [Gaiellaceae bacterium]